MKTFGSWFLFLLLIGPCVTYASDEGTSAVTFLKIPPTAREMAMGGAGGPLSEGSSGLYWNPSQLGAEPDNDVVLSRSSRGEGLRHHFAAWSTRVRKAGGWGLSVNQFDLGEIDQVDAIGAPVGRFHPQDVAVSLGAAGQFSRWRAGAALKGIYSKILHSDTVYSGDAGLSYRSSNRKSRVSMVGKNLFGSINYVSQDVDITRLYGIGVSHQWSRFTVALEESFASDGEPSLAAGLEAQLVKTPGLGLQFRSGFNQAMARDKDDLAGLGFGLGLGWGRLSMDYAWSLMGELGDAHTFTLRWAWTKRTASSATINKPPLPKTEN